LTFKKSTKVGQKREYEDIVIAKMLMKFWLISDYNSMKLFEMFSFNKTIIAITGINYI